MLLIAGLAVGCSQSHIDVSMVGAGVGAAVVGALVGTLVGDLVGDLVGASVATLYATHSLLVPVWRVQEVPYEHFFTLRRRTFRKL